MNRLRELRKSNNLSMKEFGLKFGLAESTISLYETGKRFPDPQQLIAFANYFNVSIDYLLGREDSFGAPYPYDTQNRPEQKRRCLKMDLNNRILAIKQELKRQKISYEKLSTLSGIPVDTLKKIFLGPGIFFMTAFFLPILVWL